MMLQPVAGGRNPGTAWDTSAL